MQARDGLHLQAFAVLYAEIESTTEWCQIVLTARRNSQGHSITDIVTSLATMNAAAQQSEALALCSFYIVASSSHQQRIASVFQLTSASRTGLT